MPSFQRLETTQPQKFNNMVAFLSQLKASNNGG